MDAWGGAALVSTPSNVAGLALFSTSRRRPSAAACTNAAWLAKGSSIQSPAWLS